MSIVGTMTFDPRLEVFKIVVVGKVLSRESVRDIYISGVIIIWVDLELPLYERNTKWMRKSWYCKCGMTGPSCEGWTGLNGNRLNSCHGNSDINIPKLNDFMSRPFEKI